MAMGAILQETDNTDTIQIENENKLGIAELILF